MALVRSPHRFIVYRDTPPAGTDYLFKISDIRSPAGAAELDLIAAWMLRVEVWDHVVAWSIAGSVVPDAPAIWEYSWTGGGPLSFTQTMGVNAGDGGFTPTAAVASEADLIEINDSDTPLVGDVGAHWLSHLSDTLPAASGTHTGSGHNTDGDPFSISESDAYHTVLQVTSPSKIYIVPDGTRYDAYVAGSRLASIGVDPPFDATFYGPVIGGDSIYTQNEDNISVFTKQYFSEDMTGLFVLGQWTITVHNWIGSGTTTRTFDLYSNRPNAQTLIPSGPFPVNGTIDRTCDIASAVNTCLPYGYDRADPLGRTTLNRAWNTDGTAARAVWSHKGARWPA